MAEIRFTVMNQMKCEWNIECCGELMTIREGKQKHWNDHPYTMRCKKCGKWYKGNYQQFDSPRPKHVTVSLKEVKRSKKNGK